jgi:TRAP-type C4-dicarboxylate transport system substrate-binding protein
MKKNLLILVVLITCVCLIVTGCGGSQEPNVPTEGSKVSYEPVEWEAFLSAIMADAHNDGIVQVAKNVEERTDGKFKINLRVTGEVPYDPTEIISTVSQNLMQIGDALTANSAGEIPSAALPSYPFLIPSWDESRKVMDAIQPYVEAEMLDKRDVSILFNCPDPPQYIWGKGEPVTTLEDFSGTNFRGHNVFVQSFFAKVGANSISIPYTEIATAISRNVIEGFVTGSSVVTSTKFYEMIDWVTEVPFGMAGSWWIVNNEAFNELPEEWQDILVEECQKASDLMWNEVTAQVHETNMKEIAGYKDGYIKILPYDQEFYEKGRDLMKDDWDKWATESGQYSIDALDAAMKVLGN